VHIRKKKNRSGSTSVVVVDKSNGNYKELVSIGTCSNEADIKFLCEKAHQWIIDYTHSLVLDFDNKKQQTEAFINQIDQVLINGSQLLLNKIFDKVGFGAIKDEVFRHLVISRLSFPGSKRATAAYLKDYFNEDVDLNQIYRYMDKLQSKYQSQIQKISVEHTIQILGNAIGIVFYDVTTLYFESGEEDDLRICGFSKDGKHQNPQVVLGLLVSAGGYPLAYQIFEGNTFEGHTMLQVIDSFAKQYDIAGAIVVADAGLMSSKNIAELEKKKYKYIIGAKIKNESADIKKWILSQTLEDGQFSELKKEDNCRLIIGYSIKRAMKDFDNRQKGIKRLEKLNKSGKLTKSSINKRGYNKYLTLSGKIDVAINYELFETDKRWDGLKGYRTNTTLNAFEVHENYSNLWRIENAFRVSKSTIEIRPMFHFTTKRIQAHVCICFAAYKVYKELERLLCINNAGISPETAINIAKTICTIKVKVPDSTEVIEKVLLLTSKQKSLAKIFDI